MMVGLLPMPGGALISAIMIKDLVKKKENTILLEINRLKSFVKITIYILPF